MFFIKFLPCEGKFHKGAFVKLKPSGKLARIGSEDSFDGFTFMEHLDGGDSLSDEWDYVRPSLCTRDIAVGDKALWSYQGDWNVECEVTKIKGREYSIKCDGTGKKFDVPLEEIFKVIGKISPEAMPYVIEGQEFSEDELLFMRVDRENGGGWKYTTLEDCKGFPTFVEVKKHTE
jgi:hypothetical protein